MIERGDGGENGPKVHKRALQDGVVLSLGAFRDAQKGKVDRKHGIPPLRQSLPQQRPVPQSLVQSTN
jgi:hypothetical protein